MILREGKISYIRHQITKSTRKIKPDRSDFIKFKTICSSKGTINKMSIQVTNCGKASQYTYLIKDLCPEYMNMLCNSRIGKQQSNKPTKRGQNI